MLIKNKFNVNAGFTALKTGSYFQLKCSCLISLISDGVYKFTCSSDTNVAFKKLVKGKAVNATVILKQFTYRFLFIFLQKCFFELT